MIKSKEEEKIKVNMNIKNIKKKNYIKIYITNNIYFYFFHFIEFLNIIFTIINNKINIESI